MLDPNAWRPSREETNELLRDSARVVPFVGAGLGVPVGLPSGRELALRLRTEHPLAAGKTFEAPYSLITVASALAQGGPKDRSAVTEFILDVLDIEKHGYRSPATLRQLVHIPSKWYATTTYDLLPELAAQDEGVEYESFTWRDLPVDAIGEDPSPRPLYIVHLHGSVDDPDSLILDGISYGSLSRDGGVHNFLHLLFHLYRVCFFGTSLDESYLQTDLLAWRTAMSKPRHVLIDDEAGVEIVTQGRAAVSPEAHGVIVESFPTGRFELLDEFCRSLVTQPPSTAAPLQAEEAPALLPLGGSGQPPVEVRYVRSDWGPDWTQRALGDLGEHEPAEALKLREALGANDSPKVVRELVRRPPKWSRDGSHWLWVALARFAEQQGDWKLAGEAWLTVRQRPGADVVRCLVAASVSAELTGDRDNSNRLLDEARELDEQHPRVLLQEVAQAESPEEALAILRELGASEDEDVAAIAHAHAALIYLQQEKFAEADEHLQAAKLLRPELLQTRIVGANAVIHRNRIAMATGSHIDAQAVARGAEECLEMRDKLLRMRRFGESVRLLMLAADASALQWDFDGAERLLLSAQSEELRAEGGRVVLADAAIRAQRYEAALKLLTGAKEDVRAMRATAELAVGNDEQKKEALRTLDKLVHENGPDADRAAIVRATRAHEFPDEGWPDEAERLLIDDGDDEVALVSKAMWLHASGDPAAARKALEPAARDKVRVADTLLQLAMVGEEQEQAAEVARHLLTLGPDPMTRVRCASVLYDLGDVERAKSEAAVVASDRSASAAERGSAYNLLVGIAGDIEHDYEQALDLCGSWNDVDPRDERRIWAQVVALARLARHEEALHLLDGTRAVPRTMGQARIAASVYARMDDPVEGLRRLTELQDRAPERDDELERQVQLYWLHRGGNIELPEDLRVRFEQPLDVRKLGLDVVSMTALRDQTLQRQATGQVIWRKILDGRLSTMVLAAQAGHDIGALWMGLGLRPVGFGATGFDEADRQAAGRALTRGAVFDPTALFTIGGLGGDFSGAALGQLARRSCISQAALDDIDAGRAKLLPEKPAMSRQHLTFDTQTGESVMVTWAVEDVERDHARAGGMLELAHRLHVEPDIDNHLPTPPDKAYDGKAPTSLRAFVATFAVAYRTGLPIYSDDRHVRLLAFEAGLPAFGTPALLDVLREQGALSPESVQAGRDTLRANGFAGITPTTEELVSLVDAADGEPSQALRLALYDPAPWRADYLSQVRRMVEFLGRVYERYPETFDDWTTRALASMTDCVGLTPPEGQLGPTPSDRLEFHASWMLAISWITMPLTLAGGEFCRALRGALNRSAKELGATIDPFESAVGRYGVLASRAGLSYGLGVPAGVLALLSVTDTMRLFGIDVGGFRGRELELPASLFGTDVTQTIARSNRRAERSMPRPRRGKKRRH